MSDDIKVGDAVTWTSSGGSSKGRVKKKLTAPMEIKGHHVAASSDNPEYLVESESGGQAAHKPGSLKKSSARTKKSTGKSSAAKSSAKKPAAKRPSAKTSARKPSAKKASAKKSTTSKKSTSRKAT